LREGCARRSHGSRGLVVPIDSRVRKAPARASIRCSMRAICCRVDIIFHPPPRSKGALQYVFSHYSAVIGFQPITNMLAASSSG
jgi:hypothetical protein